METVAAGEIVDLRLLPHDVSAPPSPLKTADPNLMGGTLSNVPPAKPGLPTYGR